MWKRWSAIALCVLGIVLVRVIADQPGGSPPGSPDNRGGNGNEPATPALEKMATSKVANVTVYPNSALVTREVEVPEGTGMIELVVTPLPEMTVNSSLYSEGTDGIRVLTTRFRTSPIKEDTREEVRKLEEQRRKLETDLQKLDADLRAAEANMKMLDKLEGFTAANTQHATEKGTLNAETIISLSKHVMDKRVELSKEVVALQQQKQDKQEQLDFVKRQREEKSAGHSRIERDAVIVIDKANKASGKVRLNYLVGEVVWRPQYKFRAGKDEKDTVQVEYLAAVKQQTGEDWTNVSLTLSTAQPMLNAAPPDLKMLEVSVAPRGSFPAGQIARVPNPPGQLGGGGLQLGGQPGAQGMNPSYADAAKQLRSQAAEEWNKKQELQSNLLVNEAAALEQAEDILNAEDRIAKKGKQIARASNRDGPSVSYHLKPRLSVPSRNDEQVLEVTRMEMAPEFFYKAVPILAPHVYRLANLTNKSEFVLLPGEATMYQGTDFVGRMNLPLVAIGEQFLVGFGADPQLQVVRQMAEKTQTMQGGNQVLHYEYRILLSSYKTQAVSLQLWDRLPLAENEKNLVVSLNKTEPELSKDSIYLREERTKNMLRWDLKLEPGCNGEKAFAVQYDFKLELEKQMSINTISTSKQDPTGANREELPQDKKK
jgi:hypothetical protein